MWASPRPQGSILSPAFKTVPLGLALLNHSVCQGISDTLPSPYFCHTDLKPFNPAAKTKHRKTQQGTSVPACQGTWFVLQVGQGGGCLCLTNRPRGL